MKVKYSIATSFMKQYDEYADYNDYSKGMIIDKIEFCNDDENEMQQERHLEEQPLEQVEQPLEEQSLQEQSLEQVEDSNDDKVYAEYSKTDLDKLNKNDLYDILIKNNIKTKSINKITKDSIINEILSNKCKYDVAEKEQKDKEILLLQEQKDNEKILLKEQRNKEEEVKRKNKELLDKLKKQEKQVELITKNIPNLVDENVITDISNETPLKSNEYYNPYFNVCYKIPKYLLSSNNLFQKIKYQITSKYNEDIRHILKLDENQYANCKYHSTYETNDDTYFIFNTIIIIKNHITFPYGLKTINSYNYVDEKNSYSIKYQTDIYETNYNLDKIKAVHNGNNIYCYDIDTDNDVIIEIVNKNTDNLIPKKVLDKTETITEIIDRKMLCWIINNINEVAKFCYNHKKRERGVAGITFEEYLEDLKYQVNTYYTYFTDFKEYKKNSIIVNNRPAVNFELSRKYADKKYTKQVLTRPLRHMLSRKYYKDIDLSKAHFKIIGNLIRTKDYIDADKCKCILSFINNIDDGFKQFQSQFPNMSKTKIKMKLISLLFNDDINFDKHIFKEVPIFKDFLNDVLYLQDILYKQDEYADIVKNVEFDTKKKLEFAEKIGKTDSEIEKIKTNQKGKVLSRILQQSENSILECILSYFKENGIVYGTLQYDGAEILLPSAYEELGYKLPHKFFELGQDLLTKIENYVKEQIDYDITLCYKELDDGMEVPYDYIYSLERQYIIDNYNDTETCNLIIDLIKHKIKKRKSRKGEYELLYLENNKYHKEGDKREVIREFVEGIVKNANIYRFRDDKIMNALLKLLENTNYDYDSYKNFNDKLINNNINASEDFIEKIAKMVCKNIGDYVEDITDKLRFSTIDKLCFNDGVYDFKAKTFTKWGNDTIDIYTITTTGKDFPDLNNMSEKKKQRIFSKMEFLENVIKNCYKESNYDEYELRMQLLSRILAGNVNDKLWVLNIGYRNSWKSCEIVIFEKAFGDYVSKLNISFFHIQGDNGDSAKRMYQLEECMDSRFLFISEVKATNEENAGNKNKGGSVIDSSIFKNISGGDEMIFRAQYGRKLIKFYPQFVILHYCNDIPLYSNKDVLNNVMYIKTDYGFLDEKDPDFNPFCYKKPVMFGENQDTDLRTLIESDPEYADAWVLLMIKYYKPEKIVRTEKMYNAISQIKQVSNQVSYNNAILEYVVPTENENDRIHKSFVENEMMDFIIKTYENGFEPALTKKVFRGILQKLKMETSKGKLDGFEGKRHFYKYMKINLEKNPELQRIYDEWISSQK